MKDKIVTAIMGLILVALLSFLPRNNDSADALSNTPVFVQTPNLLLVQLPTAGVTPQALGPTPGINGTKVTGIWATNIDSTRAMVLQVTIARGGVNYLMSTTSVPLSSGNTNAAPTTNLMSAVQWPGLSVDSDGNPYFFLNSGDQLQINSTVAPTPAAVTVAATTGQL